MHIWNNYIILFLLGYNHDIGYDFCFDKKEHNIVGGELLKNNGYKYWKEVYYHGNPDCKYKSLILKILNMADMQIDKYGNDVGYEKRLEDIKNRYGEDSLPVQVWGYTRGEQQKSNRFLKKKRYNE